MILLKPTKNMINFKPNKNMILSKPSREIKHNLPRAYRVASSATQSQAARLAFFGSCAPIALPTTEDAAFPKAMVGITSTATTFLQDEGNPKRVYGSYTLIGILVI